jgi:hypothetical protein
MLAGLVPLFPPTLSPSTFTFLPHFLPFLLLPYCILALIPPLPLPFKLITSSFPLIPLDGGPGLKPR